MITGERGAAIGRLSLAVPEGWEDRSTVTLVGPVRDGLAQNIVITRERLCDAMGLGAYSQGYVARVGEQVPVQQTAELEHVTIAGRRGHVRRLAWSAPDGDSVIAIRQLVGLFVDGDDAYAIVATGVEADEEALEPAFRAALASLAIDGGRTNDETITRDEA